MFTGLIAATAALVKLEKKNRPVLTIRAALDKPLAVGDSLAVNGVCLTLIERKGTCCASTWPRPPCASPTWATCPSARS